MSADHFPFLDRQIAYILVNLVLVILVCRKSTTLLLEFVCWFLLDLSAVISLSIESFVMNYINNSCVINVTKRLSHILDFCFSFCPSWHCKLDLLILDNWPPPPHPPEHIHYKIERMAAVGGWLEKRHYMSSFNQFIFQNLPPLRLM